MNALFLLFALVGSVAAPTDGARLLFANRNAIGKTNRCTYAYTRYYNCSSSLESMMDPKALRKMDELKDLSAKVDAYFPETEIGAKAYADYRASFEKWLKESSARLASGEEVEAPSPKLPKLKDSEYCWDFLYTVSPLRGTSVREVVYLLPPRPSEADCRRLKFDARVEAVRRSLEGVFGAGKVRFLTKEEILK